MDELQISGKRFIASRRVAREHGYTSDYIGQLIRKGSLVGQKVGRAWYVEAASLAAFLGEEVVAPLPEPVIEPAVEVKKETAAASVAAPEAEPAEALVEEAAAEEIKTPEPELPPEEKVEEKKTAVTEERRVPLHVVSPIAKKEEAKPGLRYVADEEPAIPQFAAPKPQVHAAPVAEQELAQGSAKRSRAGVFVLAMFALGAFGLSAFVFSAVSLDLKVEEGNAATAAYSLQF